MKCSRNINSITQSARTVVPKIWRLLVLFVLGIVICARAGATQIEIRLTDNVSVEAGAVRLADIADVNAEDDQLKAKLDDIIVGRAAGSGGKIEMANIQNSLAKAGIQPGAADIFGASCCHLKILSDETDLPVTIDSVSVPGPIQILVTDDIDGLEYLVNSTPNGQKTIADELLNIISRTIGLEKARLKVDWRTGESDALQAAFEKDRFVIEPSSTIELGTVRFKIVDRGEVDDTADGQDARKRPLRVHGTVQYLCESIVAKRPLQEGQIVTAEDIELMPRRVTSFREIGLTRKEAILGQQVIRDIPMNSVVFPTMLRSVLLVKRKELVEIYSRSGPVEIRLSGIALSDGALGQTIPVRYGSDNTIATAVVIAKGRATIGSNENIEYGQSAPLALDEHGQIENIRDN